MTRSTDKMRECCKAWFRGNENQLTKTSQMAARQLEEHLKEHGAVFPTDPKSTTDLTDKQREVFDFICRTISETGNAPTIRQIAAEIGASNVNGATCHLDALQSKGYIRRGNSIQVCGVRWKMEAVE